MPTIRTAARLALGLGVVLGCGAPVLAANDSIERGRELLVQYRCGSCHNIPGVPASRGVVGPPLDAWGRRSYIAGRMPNRPELLVRWIVAPHALVPGTMMPSMGVSAAEAQAMTAYLFSLE
jgi:cytochrome c2